MRERREVRRWRKIGMGEVWQGRNVGSGRGGFRAWGSQYGGGRIGGRSRRTGAVELRVESRASLSE